MAAIVSYPYVNLVSRHDWHGWITYIHHIAISYGVWDYINPAQPHNPLVEPANPVDNPQLEITNDVFNRYKLQLDRYNHLKAGLIATDTTIMKSINPDIRHQVQRLDNIRTRLRYLAKSYCPSTVEWRSVLQDRIAKQCQPDTSTDLTTWADSWITLGQDAFEAGLPGVTEVSLRDTSLDCAGIIDYAFAAAHNHIPETDPLGQTYTLRSTIKAWNTLRRQLPSAHSDISTPVVTPVSFNAGGRDNSNSAIPSPCACGYKHKYADCFYLVDSKRPPRWPPKEEVLQRVQKFLENQRHSRQIQRTLSKNNLSSALLQQSHTTSSAHHVAHSETSSDSENDPFPYGNVFQATTMSDFTSSGQSFSSSSPNPSQPYPLKHSFSFLTRVQTYTSLITKIASSLLPGLQQKTAQSLQAILSFRFKATVMP